MVEVKEKRIIETGLTSEEVEERIKQGLVNEDTTVPTKKISIILKENFFTLFNFLNLFLAIAIFAVGSYKNMLFMGVVIINTAISTFQEIRSKKMIDKLAILAESKAKVIRDGFKKEISIHEIVLDDILEYETGNQIVADSIIQEGEVEVDESFLTGETDSIYKKEGDLILSGSIIVSGNCIAKVKHVGKDNYAAEISAKAKYVKKVKSEIMTSLNKIIRILTFAIIPIGLLLFCNQYFHLGVELKEAVVKTVAAMIGMIPEGLVLLTSTVFAVSIVRLSKRKVLVQDLYCVETLARVDVLCLDKTGTLTEGKMEVVDFESNIISKEALELHIKRYANACKDTNGTMLAIKDKFENKKEETLEAKKLIPFSSQTKWSAVTYNNGETFILGAPEFVLREKFSEYEKFIEEKAKKYRVVVLVKTKDEVEKNILPENIEVVGFIYIRDKIRKEAKDTINYFKDQNVQIKIISGDNPITVSQIAKEVGVENAENYIDASTLKTDDDIREAVDKYSVFGRVTPFQKKQLVTALKEKGHTVAMTGDGVNDVLALKEADCSIAMANGSDATKNISQLILLDSNFESMPEIVLEGRRSINNLQRSASLFLVKTIYSSILSLLFLIMQREYPFMPIQLSLISTATIGIPSFLLALEPNKDRVEGRFLKNVIKKAIPTALTAIVLILTITILNMFEIVSNEAYSSLCVIATGAAAIVLLFTLARRRKSENKIGLFSKYRISITVLVIIVFIIGLTLLKDWFSIADVSTIIEGIKFI